MKTEVDATPCVSRASSSAVPSPRVWLVLTVLLLVNSVLRGIRAPGRWAYTEILLNYDFGFSKRALQGAIISMINTPALYHYSFCFWYSFAVFAVNLLLLMELLKGLCFTQGSAAKRAVLLFSSSLAIVVLSHTVGYADQVALLVTLLALRTRSFYRRCLLVAVLFPVALLIHETEFVLFFPVVAFRFVIELDVGSERRKLLAFSAVCSCVLATLLCVGYTHMSQAAADFMYREVQQRADFPLRKDEFFMITSTFRDNLNVQFAAWRDSDFVRFSIYCLIVTLPTTIYLLRESILVLATGGRSLLIRFVAVMASLAPLSMFLIGADLNRWTTLAITASFLVLATVMLDRPLGQSTEKRTRSWVVTAVLVALNLGSSIPLFDGYIVQNFPYEELIDDVTDVLRGTAPFPPKPEQCVEVGCLTVTDGIHPRSAVAEKK